MVGQLTQERVRGDIDVLSRAGLTVEDFLDEAMPALSRAVPWDAACVGTHDPATVIFTSGRKYGGLVCSEEQDAVFMQLEYAESDETSMRSLAASGTAAVGMRLRHGQEIERSERMGQLIAPIFGFADESRLIARDDVGVWGGIALFRGPEGPSFREEEVDYLAGLSGFFARAFRSGILASLAVGAVIDTADQGPGVIIVGPGGGAAQMSVGAQERLDELRTAGSGTDPMSLVSGLAEAARRVAANVPGARMPRARVRTGSGKWLALHASPLAGGSLDIVVTIEDARPPEIIELVVASLGLTPRERGVTTLVLKGVETKEIAASLHLSAYTVQDHLKAVFDKAGVRSRRELIARICLDHYLPKQNMPVGPSGWFTG